MLFEVPEINSKNEVSEIAGLQEMLVHKITSDNKLNNVLSLVSDNCCVHWCSSGEWSMVDLLMGLLISSGPADVYISSYAFSETPARIISDLKAKGFIKNLFCLIDSRIDKRTPGSLNLVRNAATKLKLVNTHAKVTIISNDKMEFVVVGSANYTTNTRYETGVIINNKAVVDFHKKWIYNELKRQE